MNMIRLCLFSSSVGRMSKPASKGVPAWKKTASPKRPISKAASLEGRSEKAEFSDLSKQISEPDKYQVHIESWRLACMINIVYGCTGLRGQHGKEER